MLIKSADDKSRRIALLESLLQAPQLSSEQKTWLQHEVKNVRYGVQGERDAAHYIDNHFADAPNHAVIHDLRVVHEGEVAQIDHLVISRGFVFYLLETKNFSGNLQINEFGEFTVNYGPDRAFGIPSPLEQSRRHENVLTKVLEQLGITGRVQRKPDFRHVVLIHPKCTIQRPDAKKYDTSSVIKADQFASWHKEHVEKDTSTFQVLGSIFNLRSADTVRQWAEKLASLHSPPDLLALPEFLQSRAAAPITPPAVARVSTPAHHPAAPVAPTPTLVSGSDDGTALKKRCICATCAAKISYAEAKFCWNNPRRFGGLQYCREHQGAFV
ncbi:MULTISPECIES: nuclease-related domain-containing protein [Giesbergeria]|uniref:Nuclease-related domain-containing protein n=1 Tax=Giesbergeria sinuosa TaxID=80883 RepID=A0ABV9QET9_9BURK